MPRVPFFLPSTVTFRRATVTPVPIRRHEHRMWTATPEEERARLSKRNFYRFLDRWRGRTDLLVKPPPPTSPG